MRSYPVGAATYSKHPSRYSTKAPQGFRYASGAWVGEDAPARYGPLRITHKPSWLDLTSGLGAVILGHQHPSVVRRMAEQMNAGISFPMTHPLEYEVAERLLSLLTWERAESVRFGKNGADVTTSAVRIARAVTGKDTVIYCDYHGHHDWSMTEPPKNGGVPFSAQSWKVERSMEGIGPWLADDDVAAVVLEGVSSYQEHDDPPNFLADLRRACDERGVLLILDEMITGFRMAPGGAAEALGIEPDIACYGKAMANGMPLSAIVGPWDYLKRYESDVFFSMTHGGEALSLAAADETMRILYEQDVCTTIGNLGEEVVDLVGGRAWAPYPQRIVFDFSPEDLDTLADHHVLCAGYANLTLAHATDAKARSTLLSALEDIK